MKKIVLMSSLFTMAAASADTTQVAQDDILKESTEVLNCVTVDGRQKSASAIKPTLPDRTIEISTPIPAAAEVAEATEVPPVDEIAESKTLSPSEKLKAYRQKLEEKNLVLLEKKLEMIRLEQEMALLRNLERSMNKTLSAIKDL
nr:hypothetical protein BHI3_17140 [Bacteriovorax sp. HI3]